MPRPYESRRMHVLRRDFRLLCEATDERCWLCGQAIDYLIRDHDDAFELDHFHPVSLRPDLMEDPANFRASHRRCNRHRGNNAPHPSLGITSRAWGASSS